MTSIPLEPSESPQITAVSNAPERKSKNVVLNFGPVRLDSTALHAITDVLSEVAEEVLLETEDHRFKDIDQFLQHQQTPVRDLTIRTRNHHGPDDQIRIIIEERSTLIWVDNANNLVVRGATDTVEELLRGHEIRKPWVFRRWWPFLCLLAVPSVPWLIDMPLWLIVTLNLAMVPLWIMWFKAIPFVFRLDRSEIFPGIREFKPPFIERNKDDLIVGLIVGIVVAITTAPIGFIIGRMTG